MLAFALGASPAIADVRFQDPPLPLRLSEAQVEAARNAVRASFDAAVDNVAAFVGDRAARKALRNVDVELTDIEPREPLTRPTVKVLKTPHVERVRIRVYAVDVLSGMRDAESLLTRLLAQAYFEERYKHKGWAAMPMFIKNGIGYYGAGTDAAELRALLNSPAPDMNAEAHRKRLRERRDLDERTFFACFEKEYGEAAAKNLIGRMNRAEPWKDALAGAAGEAKWQAVRDRARTCGDETVGALVDGEAARALREGRKLYNAGRYADVVAAFGNVTADDPWAVSKAWTLAESQSALFDAEAAAKTYDGIRSGRFGLSADAQDAAYAAVTEILDSGDCVKAKEMRAADDVLYDDFPRPLKRRALDRRFERECVPSTATVYAGRKALAAGDAAEALRLFDHALVSSAAENTPTDATLAIRALRARALSAAGRGVEALAAFDEVLAARRLHYADRRQDIAEVQIEAGDAAENMGRHDEALERYLEAVALQKQSLGPFNDAIPATQHRAGRAWLELGDHDQARAQLAAALVNFKHTYKSNDILRARILFDLARAERELGDADEAREHATKAYALFADHFPADHKFVAAARELAQSLK